MLAGESALSAAESRSELFTRRDDARDAAAADGGDLEARLEARRLGVRGEPGLGSATDTPPLLAPDHLERVAVAAPPLPLHLAEDERPPASQHEVELVAARPGVALEDAVAAQPVVQLGEPFARYAAAAAVSTSGSA